jgi:23S rRNA (adenine1618-N6)-methyltransferase
MHVRNRHKKRYDFKTLIEVLPGLASFVIPHPVDGDTIDFSNPVAVKALNHALLRQFYAIQSWDIPATYLCPPIPGRADYIHCMADIITERGVAVRVLDVGVGANCIYPLIGHREYGWRFVGSDIDLKALMAADKNVSNNKLSGVIELRSQRLPENIFRGVIQPGEKFDLTICNPPFFASLEEAETESRRKWQNLGVEVKAQHRNFGGQGSELWCPGGELGFLKIMVDESAFYADQVRWFSSVISKERHVKAVEARLAKAGATQVKIIEMEQGQKKGRAIVWSFH